MTDQHPLNDRISVLYVDDFEPERALVSHRLRESSIALTALPSVDDAIAALNAKRYDLVLCDLYFANGRSGEELLHAARSGGLHDGPFVFLSGESDMELLTALMQRGASAVLTKPIDSRMLPELITSMLLGTPGVPQGAIDPGFLTRTLPGCLDELSRARQQRDGKLAERVCRDLASTASGYGLTMVARSAEQAVGSLAAGIASEQARTALDRVTGHLDAALRAAA